MSKSFETSNQNESMATMQTEKEYDRPVDRVAKATENTDYLISIGLLDLKDRQDEIDSYFPLTTAGRAKLHEDFRIARGMPPKA